MSILNNNNKKKLEKKMEKKIRVYKHYGFESHMIIAVHKLIQRQHGYTCNHEIFFMREKITLFFPLCLKMETETTNYDDNPALMRLRTKRDIPHIDFTLFTQEDGTVVSTRDRVIKGFLFSFLFSIYILLCAYVLK